MSDSLNDSHRDISQPCKRPKKESLKVSSPSSLSEQWKYCSMIVRELTSKKCKVCKAVISCSDSYREFSTSPVDFHVGVR
jgi:hypothetical protein